ncbi:hypothetical protein MMC07_005519 [Pseudocyphellaria aurata]|nr:hypothetical protein [Pseudocyphellaria aurata]
MSAAADDERDLRAEIAGLESQLSTARDKLHTLTGTAPAQPISTPSIPIPLPTPTSTSTPTPTPSHALLLLADSALPLGSFAFSSGLESYLAHHRLRPSSFSFPSFSPPSPTPSSLTGPFPHFLSLSLYAVATTSLPYLLVAYRHPRLLAQIDVACDAATLCPVARRASLAQGRALLTAWERAFRDTGFSGEDGTTAEERNKDEGEGEARDALRDLSAAMRTTQTKTSIHTSSHTPSPDSEEEEWLAQLTQLAAPSGHFAPLWGAVTRAEGLSANEAAYVFLLGHAKAVAGAGVRAGGMGPYQAQALLASKWLRAEIRRAMRGGWRVGRAERAEGRAGRAEERGDWWGEEVGEGEKEEGDRKWMREIVEEAGQGVPAMDLWMGRHELLYSRIFNS